MTAYLLPVILVGAMVYALVKKVNVYDCFLDGARDSLTLVRNIFPYIAVIFIAIELFRASGLAADSLGLALSPHEISGHTPRDRGTRPARPPLGQRRDSSFGGYHQHLRSGLLHRKMRGDDSGRV